MAGITSLDAVKRKIKSLQDQVDSAEERAERIQKEVVLEKKAREQVSMFRDCASAQSKARPPFATSSTVLLQCSCVELFLGSTQRSVSIKFQINFGL